jgi:DNA-nicking Smr family endonuclease
VKKEKPFHNPFAGLKLKPNEAPKAAPRPAPRPPAPVRRAPPAADEVDEETLFRTAVGEVEPVRGGAPLAPHPAPPTADQLRIQDAEEEALIQLSELVAGEGTFDLADTDEYIEGAVAGLDPRILRRLRSGGYSIQAHLDLHGMLKDQAKQALERFVEGARRQGLRCVLVVHGRGLHSKDQLPVLKDLVRTRLARGRLAKQVLAFSTARPHDGGAGAVYVLLRR